MIPLFRTRLNQDSFEVFDWTLEIPNQIQKYSRLKLKGFSGSFLLSRRHEEVIRWHFFVKKWVWRKTHHLKEKWNWWLEIEREKKNRKNPSLGHLNKYFLSNCFFLEHYAYSVWQKSTSYIDQIIRVILELGGTSGLRIEHQLACRLCVVKALESLLG